MLILLSSETSSDEYLEETLVTYSQVRRHYRNISWHPLSPLSQGLPKEFNKLRPSHVDMIIQIRVCQTFNDK